MDRRSLLGHRAARDRKMFGMQPSGLHHPSCALCHRAGAHVNHQPLIQVYKTLNQRLGVSTMVEDSTPFAADREYSMDIGIMAEERRDSTNSYHQEEDQICVKHIEPQSAEYLKWGRPNVSDCSRNT